MREWLAAMTRWRRLPLRSGLAELDLQIEKLRNLRDSYRVSLQAQRHESADVAK